MFIKQAPRTIDIGRLVILPIFTLLMIINIRVLTGEIKALDSVSPIKMARLIHCVLIACFYALSVFLYLIRSSAKATTNSFIAKTTAVIATFMPFAIPALSKPASNPDIMLFANLVTIFGMSLTLYSLSVLGRSFSIIPQARSLVRSGPYKVVRHPLYLGELIAILGVVLARFSISTMAVFCLLTALQIYRALQEERVLAGAFPEYEPYSMKSARFIPGIF